ncbi:MAG: radical SAM protein, partial [Desulfobacteraceae bacterium]
MNATMDSEKNQNILLNRREYGELYDQFKWAGPAAARLGMEQRAAILTAIDSRVEYRFHHTKLVYQDLSPGCRLCGDGAWSCLFINNLCNGQCFFCPAEQTSKSEPATNGIPFPNPRDYIDYIKKFNFQGASISGGEPLLTFDRTLLFVDKIKKAFGSALYLWLYSNGLVADHEKLARLRDAGLDEIRFNLIASNYDLTKIKMAVDLIPAVTIEIPAAPDHAERLQRLVPELSDLGVRFLNLHQLRCTPHNAQAM